MLLNKELTPTLPGWIKNPDGSAAKVEKVDDDTVRFTYAAPATLFLTAVANQDGADRTYAMFLPAHYLKKFHPATRAKADIEKMAQAAGFKTWTELFANKNAPPENPERPTMAAWAPTSRASDPVFTLKRNPYYVGVDKDGNQLPYHRRGALHLLRRRAGAQPRGDRRQLRHAGAPHQHDQLSGAEGAGEDRQVSRSSPGRPSAAPTRSSPSTRPTRPIRRWAR